MPRWRISTAKLNAWLDRLHIDRRENIDQTLRLGTQTPDNLFGAGMIRSNCCARRSTRPLPTISRACRSTNPIRCTGASAGSSAIPPRGRRACTTAAFTPTMCTRRAGSVRPITSPCRMRWRTKRRRKAGSSSANPICRSAIADAVRRSVRPRVGTLVLFPSYLWHGTIPFHSQHARTTIAFDAIPL